MSYNDEYHGSGSKICYDGELLPAEDVAARYKRDESIKEKYAKAEENVDELQMTWDDVEDTLSKKLRDPRAGRRQSYGPGGPM